MRGESSSQLGVSVLIPTQQSTHVFDVVKLLFARRLFTAVAKRAARPPVRSRAIYFLSAQKLFRSSWVAKSLYRKQYARKTEPDLK
jgi:hypothetical protein